MPEKVRYVDGFGAAIVRVVEEGDDEGDWGGWFSVNWKNDKRTASGRLRWEDERDTWF